MFDRDELQPLWVSCTGGHLVDGMGRDGMGYDDMRYDEVGHEM